MLKKTSDTIPMDLKEDVTILKEQYSDGEQCMLEAGEGGSVAWRAAPERVSRVIGLFCTLIVMMVSIPTCYNSEALC